MNEIPCPRSTLIEVAQMCCAIMDNKDRPASLRKSARQVFEECSEALLYNSAVPFELVPLAFHISGEYRDFVREALAELPAELVASEPIRVKMLHMAAELVDSVNDYGYDVGYCSSFRLEALESLRGILRQLAALTAVEN